MVCLLPLKESALKVILPRTFLMTLSPHPGGALPPPPTPLPTDPPEPPSLAAMPRRLAILASRRLSASALALICAGVSAAGFGASTFLGGSTFLGTSFGGAAFTGLGGSLTTSFSFLGGSFSTGFFFTAISAASSFISVLSSGVGAVSTCCVESQSSTSTPAGVLLFQLMPITRKATKPRCAIKEKVKARFVLSSLVSRPRPSRLFCPNGFCESCALVIT